MVPQMSFDEIMAFEQNISRPIQPHIALGLSRMINKNFMRSIQISLPPSLAISFQYQSMRTRLLGGFSVDGSVQCSLGRVINPSLMYSMNAMVSPTPESLKVCCDLVGLGNE